MISRGWSERISCFPAPRGSAVGKPPGVSPRDRNNKTDRKIHRPRVGKAITGADRRGNLRGSLRDAQAQAAAVGAQQPVAKSTGCQTAVQRSWSLNQKGYDEGDCEPANGRMDDVNGYVSYQCRAQGPYEGMTDDFSAGHKTPTLSATGLRGPGTG